MSNASYGTKIAIVQGGEVMQVKSGGSIALDTGADITVNGESLIDEVAALSGLDATELGFLNGVSAGTATASKAVVLGASKEIATITTATITTLNAPTVNATNVDAGASGTAGTVDVFPTTASKGKTALTATDNTGDTTTTINTAAQASTRTYTVPDAGATAGVFPLLAVSTIAAAGADQAAATQITSTLTYVTASDGNKGVKLPGATAGAMYIVYDTVATSGLKIYPASGDDINDGSTDAAIVVEGKTMAIFIGLDTTTWAANYTANT